MAATGDAEEAEWAAALRRFSIRYCWDADPAEAPDRAAAVVLRTMDVGTWEDLLDLERIAGRDRLVAVLAGAAAGALKPRS